MTISPSVVAMAGRRVDAPGAQPRFPESSVGQVDAQLRFFFRNPFLALVCSAAAGADLLALGIAGELQIRRRVVLPFDRTAFRRSSVEDRKGDWLDLYDEAILEIERAHDLIELGFESNDPDAYLKTNIKILKEAVRLAEQQSTTACAIVVWDGERRGPEDFTAHFRDEALTLNLPVTEIRTL